jgi:hypothetical protein
MNSATLPPPIWTTCTTEALKTGTWRAALPAFEQAPAPCHLACPVEGRIAQWMQQALARDWHGAWLTLTENNPFPAIVGRVCHHPCESACNRAGYDSPLAICALERYVGDLALPRAGAMNPYPSHARSASPSSAAGPPGSRPRISCAGSATRSRSSKRSPRSAASCATAFRPTACRATCSTARSNACSRSASRWKPA